MKHVRPTLPTSPVSPCCFLLVRNSTLHVSTSCTAAGRGPLANSSAVREYYKNHIIVFTVPVFHIENTTIKNNFSIQAQYY
jgi:hypothetical protein